MATLERNEVVELAKRNTPVKRKGYNSLYILMGYKVEFDREGTHLSVCLLDEMKRKTWVKYTEVERVTQ